MEHKNEKPEEQITHQAYCKRLKRTKADSLSSGPPQIDSGRSLVEIFLKVYLSSLFHRY